MAVVMLKATLTAREILVLCDQKIEWEKKSQQRDHGNKEATGQQASQEYSCLTALSSTQWGATPSSLLFLCSEV